MAARIFSACRLQAPSLAMLSTNTFAPIQRRRFGSQRPTIRVALICPGVPRARSRLRKPHDSLGDPFAPRVLTASRLHGFAVARLHSPFPCLIAISGTANASPAAGAMLMIILVRICSFSDLLTTPNLVTTYVPAERIACTRICSAKDMSGVL